MGAAMIGQQKTVALRMISCIVGIFRYFHQSAITILTVACRNSLRYNSAPSIFTQVNHFCAGIGLLKIVGYRYRIKFSNRIVAGQYA